MRLYAAILVILITASLGASWMDSTITHEVDITAYDIVNSCNHDKLIAIDDYWGMSFTHKDQPSSHFHRQYKCKQCKATVLIGHATSLEYE